MSDHERGCQGREYVCTCGHDAKLDAELKRLQKLLQNRDRMAETSRKFWVRAAKAAMAGDFRELRNRVELAEAEPMQIVHSTELQRANS